MAVNALPQSLADNPFLDQWIGFGEDRTVRLATGKVELGQGVLTALCQIAAEELDVAPARVCVVSGDTARSPNEGFTAGSRSIEVAGAAVQRVCVQVRQYFLEYAAGILECEAAALVVQDGCFLRQGEASGHDYWSLHAAVDLHRKASDTIVPKARSDHRLVGQSMPRLDLPAKIAGAAYIHDLLPAGLVHARVLRQPRPGAKLTSDDDLLRRAAGASAVLVRRGQFLAVVADDETTAVAAAERVGRRCVWDAGAAIPAEAGEPAFLLAQEARDRITDSGTGPVPAQGATKLQASYSRPYLAHASIAPSCALARFERGRLRVWTHSQGVFELRAALARALGLAIDDIEIVHCQSAGCYGHNGADDAALDAALVAVELSPCTVRVQWSRADELRFSPFGPAALVRMSAFLDAQNRPLDWTLEVWSGPHGQRPSFDRGINLLGARALPGLAPDPEPVDLPDAIGGGATRNGVPAYAVGRHRVIHHLLPLLPVRTSSLRSLGAHLNVFATECFIDELARKAGEDPIAYRLSLLTDARARKVVETVAAMAKWSTRGAGGDGRGMGLGFARYKNRAGYCAVVAEVQIEGAVQLLHVWCATDAGYIINPDGALNQIEGGIIQSASWTLKEAVCFDNGEVVSTDWDGYPILTFSEVPQIWIQLVDAPGQPPLGIGEVAQGPTAAAIGNAVAHALGVPIRDLPLTRDRILSELLRSDGGN